MTINQQSEIIENYKTVRVRRAEGRNCTMTKGEEIYILLQTILLSLFILYEHNREIPNELVMKKRKENHLF